ncbi:MAG: hypothetical protein JKY65_28360 [Planctomycetes bacterium]|nr:hypothetical protein [Planctomycetota bacterium]
MGPGCLEPPLQSAGAVRLEWLNGITVAKYDMGQTLGLSSPWAELWEER